MRVVLVGAVESTRVALEALIGAQMPPVAVFTLPIEKASRHSDFVDLRRFAEPTGIQVLATDNINEPEAIAALEALEPDYALVIGWSQICHKKFLQIPRKGSVGFHPAPIPENRGRGVIPWTILQRRTQTGATLFWLAEGVDDGAILIQELFAVDPDETAATLYDKHMRVLRSMLDRAIPLLAVGSAPRIPQDNIRASYCAKRTPADGFLDWTRSADDVWTLVRAVGRPYPGAFTYWRGRKLTIWEADYVGDGPYFGLPGQVQARVDSGVLVQCGDGKHVLLKTVQVDDGEPKPASAVLRQHEKLGIDVIALVEQLRREGGNGWPNGSS